MAKKAAFTSPDLVAGQAPVGAKPPTQPGYSLGGVPRAVKVNLPKAGALIPKGQSINISHTAHGMHVAHGMAPPPVDMSVDVPSPSVEDTVGSTIRALHKKFKKGNA